MKLHTLRCPKYVADGWVWVYNTAATICQGLRENTDIKVLKEKLSLNCDRSCSSADTPYGRPFALPSNLPDPAVKSRIIVACCKHCCSNPYDVDDKPPHLPAGLMQYVLDIFATTLLPYYATTDDVSTPPILITVAKITAHQCVCSRGRASAVLYETHWKGIFCPVQTTANTTHGNTKSCSLM